MSPTDMNWARSVTRSRREAAWISGLLVVMVAALVMSDVLERMDALIYDQLAVAGYHQPHAQILIVAIDEKSLQTLGRWPWSRQTHAALLERLAAAGDNVVAVDLLLAEPEADSAADSALASALHSHGNVILPVVPVARADQAGLVAEGPLPRFASAATVAHADVDPDADGVVRRIYLYGGIGASTWPALGFALVQRRAEVAAPLPPPAGHSDAATWVRTGETLIPFAGPTGTYARVSYVDVLNGRVPPERLRGKYIIVGMTAAGLGARFTTPATLANRLSMSGAELQANIVDTLLTGRAITALGTGWTLAAALLWLGAGLLLMRQHQPHRVLLGLTALATLMLFATALTLRYLGLWLAPAAALVGLLTIYPAWSWRQLHWYMASLFSERGQSQAALALVQDGIIALDAKGHVRYLSSAAEAITGRSLAATRGLPLEEIAQLQPVEIDAVAGQPHIGDPLHIATHYLTAPDGSERAVRVARHPLPGSDGSIIAITDVTENLTMAQQISHQATHDTLTGLPNRTILSDRLAQMIASARRRGQSAAVLFIDLDGFKKVNDALGHAAGDLLLCEVAKRLSSRIRAEDTVARWGGDEFVILVRRLNDENAIIGFANQIIALLEQPFDLDGQEAFISASIGISLFPRDGLGADQLLLRADTAMYRAKNDGGHGLSVFSHEVGAWTRERLNLENDLRLGIQTGALRVLYQPIVDLSIGRMVHMEALVRWLHPTHGLLSPDRFLPLAESAGLIHEIGAQVLHMACADAQRLADHGLPVGVSVNVSPQQLVRGELLQLVGEALAASGLAPTQLTLEVTENGIISDTVRAASAIDAIRNLGISIALDDFGTGYSSLSLLRDYPIDVLKIDRSFVPNPGDRDGDLTIAQAIIGMGHSLLKIVIAEGVETAWHARTLNLSGCHLQQGYLHSPPVAIERIPEVAARLSRVGIPRGDDAARGG
ncbi:MAG: EAL domain-containing protein [Porticoccaceae bacterium]